MKMERASCPALDERLGEIVKVLDHGFIRVVDYMGTEESIANTARVSYQRGTRKTREDQDLLRYLLRARHSSPLEFGQIVFHVKLPIFVARQWVRHRTSSLSEMSARYSILDNEFYIPSEEDIGIQSTSNKQGREGGFNGDEAFEIQNEIREISLEQYKAYERLLNECGEDDEFGPGGDRPGLARELARMVLGTNIYTQWYWKIDMHNLMHFLSLRMDPHAQKEIRMYADVIFEIAKVWMPNVMEAFIDYKLHAHTFSRQEMELIRQVFAAVEIPETKAIADQFNLGTQRERIAFWKAVGKIKS